MSLVADYGDSTSTSSLSSAEDSDSEHEIASPPQPLIKTKLPAPNFLGEVVEDSEVLKSSVFKNPFTEAENAKEAILQRHVKMVDSKDKVILINGKKICWNYRKGRCRFGHNCKFAHDSDLQKTQEQMENERQVRKQHGIVCQSQDLTSAQTTEAVVPEIKKSKKRPGLTQGLVPGKKVMKSYFNQKS